MVALGDRMTKTGYRHQASRAQSSGQKSKRSDPHNSDRPCQVPEYGRETSMNLRPRNARSWPCWRSLIARGPTCATGGQPRLGAREGWRTVTTGSTVQDLVVPTFLLWGIVFRELLRRPHQEGPASYLVHASPAHVLISECSDMCKST